MSFKGMLTGLVLALLLAAGLHLRVTGLAAPSLHPDEPTIARWLGDVAEHGRLQERLYAGGFFKLAMPFRAAGRAVAGARARWAYRTGAADRLEAEWDDLLFARRFNVALGLLTGVALFLLVLQVSGSRAAALAAAAVLLLNPVHVEHCHYAETDVAMLFWLVATLWLWARALAHGTRTPLLAGAIAAGFAAGTKFPLLLLVVPLLLLPRAAHTRDGKRPYGPWRMALFSLLLFLAVLVWTNPVLLEPARFLREAAAQSRGLRNEMTLSMGASAATPALQALWRLRLLGRHLADLNLPFLLLVPLGFLLFGILPRLRRHWPLLLTAFLILAIHLFASPFLRKQEFLLHLPFLALLAALPLTLSRADSPRMPRVIPAAAGAATLAALFLFNIDAARVSALFGWKDTRLLAREWLAIHAPADKLLAYEQAAAAAAEGFPGDRIPLRHVADLHEGFARLEPPPDYILRNASIHARGIVDPATGRPHPRHAPLLNAYDRRTVLLGDWEPLSFPRASASHVGPEIVLNGLFPASNELAVAARFPEPLFLDEAGRETAFPLNLVGGGQAVRLSSRAREIAFGGPGYPVLQLTLALITDRGPAKVEISAWGRTRILRLPDNAVTPVKLDKPFWFMTAEPYAVVRARTLRGYCLLEPRARLQWDSLRVSETAYNDFARIRDLSLHKTPFTLASDALRKRDSGALRELKKERRIRLNRTNEPVCISPAPYLPPVRLPKGRYTITLGVKPLPDILTGIPDEKPDADRFELTDGTGKTLHAGRWTDLIPGRENRLRFPLEAERDGEPELYLVTPVPRNLAILNSELTWTLRDRLEAVSGSGSSPAGSGSSPTDPAP